MLDSILGLPLHPLIVHATVVIVPLAALFTLLAALVPRFRARLGIVTPLLALAAVVLAPLSTSSGESLEGHLGHSALIEEHAEMGDLLVWWAIPLLIGAAGVWWLSRGRGARRGLFVAAAALSVVAALGTTVQVVLIGHSGAKAAWSGTVNQNAGGGEGDGD